MGATMGKNGTILDSLPSAHVSTYEYIRQMCLIKMLILR